MKTKRYCLIGCAAAMLLSCLSLLVGRYPLSLQALASGDALHWQVLLSLRAGRVFMALLGGFVLGAAGYVYQTVFRNPLASPDIIGVASGASAGAAAGILFCTGTAAVTLCSFAGALAAVAVALALSMLGRNSRSGAIVLAGIAVHALAQTILMWLKISADPERQLPSIEYWMMGGLGGVSIYSMALPALLCLVCMAVLFALHRQILMLSGDEGEMRMLGLRVGQLRLAVLLTATLAVSAVISQTGLISFIGLLAPHAARLIIRDNRPGAMVLSGLMGSMLLLLADLLARSTGSAELPVSIFTSLLGAPLLLSLLAGERRHA